MKKSLLVSLTAVLIFGLMGLGFAMWSDTVSVAASVDTGNVQVGILDVGTNDNILTDKILGGTAQNVEDGVLDAMDLGGDPQVLPGENSEGKNVASMISENVGDVYFALGTTEYYTAITETIDNAYPYYAPTTRFEIASNGTIPVKLDKIHIVETGDLSGLICESWTVTYPDDSVANFQRGQNQPFRLGFDKLVDALAMLQLHQGDVVTVDLQCSFAQETVQGSSGAITLTVHAAQWNEAGQDDPYSDIF